MRLPLLAATLAAAAATALPAHAAYYPVCTANLAPTAGATSCTSGNNPFARATRTLRVVVASGAVDATITCGTYSASGRVFPGKVGTFSVSERGTTCVARLVAAAPLTAASGVSTFTPVVIDPYPVP